MQAAGGLSLTSSTEALTKVIRGMGWKPNGPGCCRQSPTAPAPRLPFRRLHFYFFYLLWFCLTFLLYYGEKTKNKTKSGDQTLKYLAKYGYIYIPDNAIQIFNYPFFFLFPLFLPPPTYTHTWKPKWRIFIFLKIVFPPDFWRLKPSKTSSFSI